MPQSLPTASGRRPLLLGALALVSALAAPTAHAQDAEGAWHFSPVNQYGIQLTASYWNPIIAWVTEKTGVKLKLKLGRTSADTTAFVLAQEVEFVFTNHLFSPDREALGWKTFARRTTPPIHGQIIVAADSKVKDLAQLAGQDIGFPGPEATVAYKFPAAQLMQRKIEFRTVFGGNHDGIFAQLYSGKVAAVGTNSQLATAYAQREGKQFRVLWTSPPVHDLALMAAAKVPEKTRQAVAKAFATMHQDPKGREILQQASTLVGLDPATHFLASDGSEYSVYRDFYRTAPASLR